MKNASTAEFFSCSHRSPISLGRSWVTKSITDINITNNRLILARMTSSSPFSVSLSVLPFRDLFSLPLPQLLPPRNSLWDQFHFHEKKLKTWRDCNPGPLFYRAHALPLDHGDPPRPYFLLYPLIPHFILFSLKSSSCLSICSIKIENVKKQTLTGAKKCQNQWEKTSRDEVTA